MPKIITVNTKTGEVVEREMIPEEIAALPPDEPLTPADPE